MDSNRNNMQWSQLIEKLSNNRTKSRQSGKSPLNKTQISNPIQALTINQNYIKREGTPNCSDSFNGSTLLKKREKPIKIDNSQLMSIL